MKSSELHTITAPFRERNVFKENLYKKVSLMQDSSDRLFIAKRYQGHKADHCALNVEYAYQTLRAFNQCFEGIANVPIAYGFSLKEQAVYLEFLPELTSASIFSLHNFHATERFFRRCYEASDLSYLRSIKESIYHSHLIQKWISEEKPLSLGLKGDLWQNLCLSDEGELIIADVDSAALEPLGLSEMVMLAEMYASFSFKNITAYLKPNHVPPYCCYYLRKPDALLLIEATLEFFNARMLHLSPAIRHTKSYLAERSLRGAVNKFYQ